MDPERGTARRRAQGAHNGPHAAGNPGLFMSGRFNNLSEATTRRAGHA